MLSEAVPVDDVAVDSPMLLLQKTQTTDVGFRRCFCIPGETAHQGTTDVPEFR